MRIANNVEMLKLETILANGPGVINPLIVWDEKDVILFDTGLPGMRTSIYQAAANAHIPIEMLNKVLITHSDMDHIGSLSQIIHESSKEITVIAHKEEKPYIECTLPPIRLKKMEEQAGIVSGKLREQLAIMAEKLKQNYTMFKANVDKTIEDGEVLPFCGGITGVYTPGHTPGHMSYYINNLKLLIAGDILQIENDRLVKCPNFTIVDEKAIGNSLKKLSQYDIEAIVCFHGGLYRGEDISRQIAEMLPG